MTDRAPWGKTYSDLWRHPKWVQLEAGPRALWVTALSWTVESRTFGAIPTPMLAMFRASEEDAAELVRVGLWDATKDGWQLHDWDHHQTSREKFTATSKARAVSGSRGGKARHANSTKKSVTSDDRQIAKQTASNRQAEVEVEVEELLPPTPQGELLAATAPRPRGFVYPDSFELWWKTWPKKGDTKKTAFAAWEKAVKGNRRQAARVTAEHLQAAVEAYAADRNLPEQQFIPLATTWLNQDRWENGPLPPRGGSRGGPQAGDTGRAMAQSYDAARAYEALEQSGYYDQTPPLALTRRIA